jgi:hypothetical protein
MWLISDVKPKFKLSPTLKLITQTTTRAAPWWFGLGPQLSKSSLEGPPRRAYYFHSSKKVNLPKKNFPSPSRERGSSPT